MTSTNQREALVIMPAVTCAEEPMTSQDFLEDLLMISMYAMGREWLGWKIE